MQNVREERDARQKGSCETSRNSLAHGKNCKVSEIISFHNDKRLSISPIGLMAYVAIRNLLV